MMSAATTAPRILGRAIGSRDYIVQMSPKEYSYYFAFTKKSNRTQESNEIVRSGNASEYLQVLDTMIAQDESTRA